MKKWYILITLLVLVFAELTNGQTWKKVTTPSFSSTYSDSYFINANVGWIVGAAGSIRKTTDSGRTWTSITTSPAITEDLKSVFFLDANTAFIGSVSKLYKSTDGFATNTSVTVTDAYTTSTSYYGVYFVNAQKGWFLSSQSSAGKIIQTTDGGTTWTTGFTNSAGAIQTMRFFNATAGIAAGGGSGKCDIYYTKDGSTWTKAVISGTMWPTGITYTRTDIRSIYMIDANTAIAGGWGSSAAGLQPTILLKTSDGGVTWTYLLQAEADRTYEYAYDLYFKDALNGIAAGGATKSSNILRTSNGGITWAQLNTPSALQISKLFGFGDNIIAVTNSSFLFKSSNFGTSWEPLTTFSNTTMTKIYAVNDNVIYVAGQKGVILKTIDGGKNWTSTFQTANNVCLNINGIYFTDENIGYTANSYGSILKTMNGGTVWTALKRDTTAATVTNNAVAFTSANVGYVVGQMSSSIDVIWKTTDAGATWKSTTGTVAKALNAVAFFNANAGIVVGSSMKVAYTKDGGTTWAAGTVSGVPTAQATATLNGVTFFTANDAIAVGDKVTIKTSDGGATWTYISYTTDQTLNAVAYLNNNTWALGTKSGTPKSIGILQSTDKGTSWVNRVNYSVFDTTTVTYNDLAITPSGSIFVCGGSTAIYTNSPSVVSVEENGRELPTAFALEQNYPNPFNPTTKINYLLNQSGIVKLHVYDILGRLVRTLVNENQNPGKYSVEFNASGLASGTYVYRLSINNNIVTKKMVLIK